MILAVALAGSILFVVAGLAWTARLVHIGNLDAQALAEKIGSPVPASALDWPELHVHAVVPQPDEQSLVLLHVGWPAYPQREATLLVALDRGDGKSLSRLSQWCTCAASVAPMRRDGTELELRRRQSLERVHAVLMAEDFPADGDRRPGKFLPVQGLRQGLRAALGRASSGYLGAGYFSQPLCPLGVQLRHVAEQSDCREEVIPVGGLPALTVERTLADLIETGTDRSLVAGAARDAVRVGKVVAPERLVSYLDPIAARRRSDGRSLASDLFQLAGVYPEGWNLCRCRRVR